MNEGAGLIRRLIARYVGWKTRRKARAKKRDDDRIRRSVEKEWARERRQIERKRQKRGGRR
jgi:hypothetical protein